MQPDRPAYVVNPPEVDNATGEAIGESQVHDHFHKHEFFREDEESAEVDDPQFDDQDHLSEEERDPIFEVRLADTFDEINTTPYDINPEMANNIAQADIGDSPEAITVQYSSH